jgi:hypothetical protein
LRHYWAAAILMPYTRFLETARRLRHDVEAIAAAFEVSFEQAAQRLTTLQRDTAKGVPFFLIRVDPAGNVSERLDGTGLPFARMAGGCPLWAVHQSFARPGAVLLSQWRFIFEPVFVVLVSALLPNTGTLPAFGPRLYSLNFSRSSAICEAVKVSLIEMMPDGRAILRMNSLELASSPWFNAKVYPASARGDSPTRRLRWLANFPWATSRAGTRLSTLPATKKSRSGLTSYQRAERSSLRTARR